MNEPVSPKNVEATKTILVEGLADEKRLRENEQALDAAFADEDGVEPPFAKRMRRKFTEAKEKPKEKKKPMKRKMKSGRRKP